MVLKLSFNQRLPNSDIINVSYNITIVDNKIKAFVRNKIISAQETIDFEKQYNHEYKITLAPIVSSKCGSLCPFMSHQNEMLCEECKQKEFLLTNSRDEVKSREEKEKCQL